MKGGLFSEILVERLSLRDTIDLIMKYASPGRLGVGEGGDVYLSEEGSSGCRRRRRCIRVHYT